MAMIAGFVIWVVGLGSVFSFNILADFRPLAFIGIDKTIFGITDFTVANILSTSNAFLIAVFAGWVLRSKVVDEEFRDDSTRWKSYWRVANRYLAPAALLVVFVDLVLI